jgi:hypothetical protein
VTYVGIWLSSVPSFCRPSSARCQRLACLANAPVRTHFPYELLDGLVDGILFEREFGGDPLCLVCECHAALGSGVEGTLELDVLLRLRADWRLLEDDGIAEGDARGGDAPMLGTGEEFAKRVREAGRKEGDAKRG